MKDFTVKAGTKIVIGVDAGFAGTDSMTAYILTQDYTSEELGDIAWREGIQHAEMYGIYPEEDRPDEEDEDDTAEYSYNIEGWWDIYDEEEHGGHCTSRGEVHFEEL